MHFSENKKIISKIVFVAVLFMVGMLSGQGSADETHEPAVEEETHQEEVHMEEGDQHDDGGHDGEEGGHGHGETPEEYQDLANPYLSDTQAIASGKVIFESNCAACHGVDGKPVFAGAPDFTDTDMVEDMSDSFMFWRVSEGVLESGMPSWKNTLSGEERWQALTYIKALSTGGEATPLIIPVALEEQQDTRPLISAPIVIAVIGILGGLIYVAVRKNH